MNFRIRKKEKNTKDISAKKKQTKRIFYDKYKLSIPEILKYGSAGFLIGILICWLCYHSIYSLPIAVVVALFYIKIKKKELIKKRKILLRDHFAGLLESLYTALSSGYSVENGIKAALSDMEQMYGNDDVIVNEIRLMNFGLGYKKTIEELFDDLAMRSDTDDIKLFAQMLVISKRKGGTIGKLLGDTKSIICEKIDMLRERDKILASKIYELKIMSIMPAAVIIYLRLTFSGFIEQLYQNQAGVFVMTCCLCFYAGAFMLGKKIIKIDI